MAKDYGEAQDYDPRTNTDATTNDTDYLPVTLTLEKLIHFWFSRLQQRYPAWNAT